MISLLVFLRILLKLYNQHNSNHEIIHHQYRLF
jgi:hypothetical protein